MRKDERFSYSITKVGGERQKINVTNLGNGLKMSLNVYVTPQSITTSLSYTKTNSSLGEERIARIITLGIVETLIAWALANSMNNVVWIKVMGSRHKDHHRAGSLPWHAANRDVNGEWVITEGE